VQVLLPLEQGSDCCLQLLCLSAVQQVLLLGVPVSGAPDVLPSLTCCCCHCQAAGHWWHMQRHFQLLLLLLLTLLLLLLLVPVEALPMLLLFAPPLLP
jgi:hypothetical protein